MKQISQEGLRQILSEHVNDLFLPILRINADDYDYYLVSDTENLIYDGQEYLAFPFEMALPNEDENLQSVQLTISNVDRRLITMLRSISEPPSCEMDIVRVSNGVVTKEIGTSYFSMTGIKYNDNSIIANLGFEVNYLNEPAIKNRFTYSIAPGLF